MKWPLSQDASTRPVSRLLMALAFTAALWLRAVAPLRADYVPDAGNTSTPTNTIPTVARNYTPPNRSAPRSGSTVPVVSRSGSCSTTPGATLTPLAPQSHFGQTRSTQPTFAWFTPETAAYGMEFRIFAYLPGGDRQVVYETVFNSTEVALTTNLAAFALDKTSFRLTPNQTYHWQVVLLCDPDQFSQAVVTGADVVVVGGDLPTPPADGAANTIEKAYQYARASLWYDALGELLPILNQPDAHAASLSLLQDLALIEAEQPAGGDRDEQLSEVIDILR